MTPLAHIHQNAFGSGGYSRRFLHQIFNAYPTPKYICIEIHLPLLSPGHPIITSINIRNRFVGAKVLSRMAVVVPWPPPPLPPPPLRPPLRLLLLCTIIRCFGQKLVVIRNLFDILISSISSYVIVCSISVSFFFVAFSFLLFLVFTQRKP